MTLLEWTSVLGNIGELLGAIAVVITLLYLAAQVRLGKEATESNTRQLEEIRRLNMVENYMRRSERVERGYRDSALSEGLSRLNFKATTDPDNLDEFELHRMREWMHAHMHRLDSQHYQYQNGLLDEEGYQNLRKVLARWVPIWRRFDIELPRQSLRDEVEGILSKEQPDA
jgi:hypothetical protein